MIIAYSPAKRVGRKLWTQNACRRGFRADGCERLGRPHLMRLRLTEKPVFPTRNFPVVELQHDPLGHLRRRRVDGSRWSGIVQILKWNAFELAVNFRVWPRVIVAWPESGCAQVRGVHPQRLEDLLAKIFFPSFPGDGRDDLSR